MRTSDFSQHPTGGQTSLVMVGCANAPQDDRIENGVGKFTVVDTAPVVAEKPFLALRDDEWFIRVPEEIAGGVAGSAAGQAKLRASYENASWNHIDVVVNSAADWAKINTAERHADNQFTTVLVTPGVYELDSKLSLEANDVVVLGIGLPTFIAPGGASALEVTGSNVRLAGLMFEQNGQHSSEEAVVSIKSERSQTQGATTFLYDLIVRSAFPAQWGSQQRKQAPADNIRVSSLVEVDRPNVVIDNSWLWTADHLTDSAGWAAWHAVAQHGFVSTTNATGLVSYGMMNEHHYGDAAVFNGEGARVYFFQNETPYQVDDNIRERMAAYAVNAKTHEAYGINCWQIAGWGEPFAAGVKIPRGATDVSIHHGGTRYWAGNRGIRKNVLYSDGSDTELGDRDRGCSERSGVGQSQMQWFDVSSKNGQLTYQAAQGN